MNKKMILGLSIFGLTAFAQVKMIKKIIKNEEAVQGDFKKGEDTFKKVIQIIKNEYIDKNISEDDLYKAATEGVLNSLNKTENKWNSLLSPDELKNLESDLSGQVSGIGIGLSFNDETGLATVLKVFPGSPSEKAGVKAGDLIVSVNGETFKNKEFRDVVNLIRGKIGEIVKLKVLRQAEIVKISVKREAISIAPIELTSINEKTVLMKINFFNRQTIKNVEEKLEILNKNKTTNLILDLRGNSGGGFEDAVATTELFIPKGKMITQTTDREGQVQTFVSKKGLLNPQSQIVVLADHQTSSGAELFIGALRDHLKIKIVGEKTLGKWNAQKIEKLENGFAIKFSTLLFKTPRGESYQDRGLQPDIEIATINEEMPPHPLPGAGLQNRVQIKKQIIRQGDKIEVTELDPQLQAAIELFKN